MMTKILCYSLIFIMMLVSVVPVYGTTVTGSAISLDDRLKLAELSGVATPSSAVLLAATAASEVSPSQFPATYFYYNGTSYNNTTTAGNFSSWTGLVSGITTGVARSIQGLVTNIGTMSTNEVNAITNVYDQLVNIRGYIDNIENYTDGIEGSLTSIINSLGTTAGSNLNTISSRVNTTNSRLSTTNSTLSDILTAIQSQSFDLGTFIPNFIPDSSYDFSGSEWTNVTRRVVLSDGSSSSAVFSSPYMVIQLRELLRANNNAAASTYDKLFNYVTAVDYNDANYQQLYSPLSGNPVSYFKRSLWVDIRTIGRFVTFGLSMITAANDNASYTLTNYNNVTSAVSDVSIGDYIRQLGTNVSGSVGRLAYVLASDEEIAARLSAQSTQQAAVQDFISGDSDSSATASDLGDMSAGSAAIKDSLSSNASPTDALDILDGDGSMWDWFTNETKQSFEPDSRGMLRSVDNGNTPYLDSYYNDIYKYLGVNP